MSRPIRLKTISDLHRFNNISPPEHPLISLIDYSKTNPTPENNELKWVQEFYTISIKRNVAGKYRYGQQSYDFDEGLMTFFLLNKLFRYNWWKRMQRAIHQDGF